MTPRTPSLASRLARSQRLKRAIDVACAAAGLGLGSGPLLLVAALVRLTHGSPVLFSQVRPGFGGRPFKLYKFRTMREATDREGRPLPDGERLTRLGRFLRKTSIDELPELWNVLKGDMSLVGPRPLLMEYLERYTPEQARRHDVRPGITGLAQVTGRNALKFSERLAYDVRYVDEHTLILDLKILARTAFVVLTLRLEDGAGQHVSVVDDLGLNADTRAVSQAMQANGTQWPT